MGGYVWCLCCLTLVRLHCCTTPCLRSLLKAAYPQQPLPYQPAPQVAPAPAAPEQAPPPGQMQQPPAQQQQQPPPHQQQQGQQPQYYQQPQAPAPAQPQAAAPAPQPAAAAPAPAPGAVDMTQYHDVSVGSTQPDAVIIGGGVASLRIDERVHEQMGYTVFARRTFALGFFRRLVYRWFLTESSQGIYSCCR